jgi:hypothetical protein
MFLVALFVMSLVPGLLLAPVHTVAGPPMAVRHSGRIHSLAPHEGVLVVEEYGVGGTLKILRVDVRGAVVVWVLRDPAYPAQWMERPARIAELPVGTFIVVHGRHRQGAVKADRIEVPR